MKVKVKKDFIPVELILESQSEVNVLYHLANLAFANTPEDYVREYRLEREEFESVRCDMYGILANLKE